MTGGGDEEVDDLDSVWPDLTQEDREMWPADRRRRLPRRRKRRDDGTPAAPVAAEAGAEPPASSTVPTAATGSGGDDPLDDLDDLSLPADLLGRDRTAATGPEASPVHAEPTTEAPPAGPESDPEPVEPTRPERRPRRARSARKKAAAPAPAEEASPPPEQPADVPEDLADSAVVDPEPAGEVAPPVEPATPAARPPLRPARAVERTGRETAGATINLARFRALQDEATVEVLDAVSGLDEALGRVEQLSSALAAEMAEIAQVICDEGERQADRTRTELRDGLVRLGSDVEVLGETVADALKVAVDDLRGSGGGPGLERSVKQLAQGTERIEALLEDLIVAVDERPTDVSELTAKTLERLGLTVGARVEAATTTAVSTLQQAVDTALERATEQFKTLAPPTSDRSTTQALVRLEERIAELSRQREEDQAAARETLEALGATVARLAAAQAEDLERIVDTIESTRGLGPDGAEERLAQLTASVDAVADLPASTDELVTVISEQTAAFTTQMEAVRRRLSLRARGATLDRAALEQLADMVAERLGRREP